MSDPVLIILSAPNSRASLVSAMLDQHPEISALPDTNIFVADNVASVVEIHSQMGSGVSDGLLRLLAQLNTGKHTDEAMKTAQDWLAEHESWTVRQLIDSFIEKLGAGYIVDASPVNAMNEDNLNRLHETCPDANYLHLVRHPRSVSAAYLQGHGATENAYIRADDSLDDEQVWLRPNSLISEFAMSLPEGQCMRLMVEQLFADGENYCTQIAQWLGLSSDKKSVSAMLHPEKMIYAKYGPPSAPCGMDATFLEHPTIPAEEQVSLLEPRPPSEIEFSTETLKLAREYGYQ